MAKTDKSVRYENRDKVIWKIMEEQLDLNDDKEVKAFASWSAANPVKKAGGRKPKEKVQQLEIPA